MLLRVRCSFFQLLDPFLLKTLSFSLICCAKRFTIVNAVDYNDCVPSIASFLETCEASRATVVILSFFIVSLSEQG